MYQGSTAQVKEMAIFIPLLNQTPDWIKPKTGTADEVVKVMKDDEVHRDQPNDCISP
jgi:hypothetical protein